jgi:16S rRNA (adenine1518-N6/adenine1519-N6)-dimethyltransferase
MVEALDAGPDDDVLEIGPGRGALTRHLEGAVRRLVIVELDDRLAADLADRYEGRPDVLVVHQDILDLDPSAHFADAENLTVVGSIPYNITTPILFRLLERPRPRDIVLMVQQEVAERIVAAEDTDGYGALSVGVQSVAIAESLFRVRRGAFRPIPKVDSAVIRVRPRRPEPLDEAAEAKLRRLVRAAFQWRRKQLGKILRDHPDLRLAAADVERSLAQAGAEARDRPERLSPSAFISLAAALP